MGVRPIDIKSSDRFAQWQSSKFVVLSDINMHTDIVWLQRIHDKPFGVYCSYYLHTLCIAVPP